MLEALEYKEAVLQILWDGDKVHRLMCELRITLFFKAVQTSITKPECLMPFPACFFDPKSKTKRFAELQQHINSVPRLDDIKEETELPDLTWELLYWVFTNPLTIQPLTTDIANSIKELRQMTKLMDIPIPNNVTTYLFKILPSHPKEKFITAKAEFGTYFAFHGSKLENFHSIIHRGLVSALNKRSSYGVGTYLSSKLGVSRQYSEITQAWAKTAFGYPIFVNPEVDKKYAKLERGDLGSGIIQCVAIIEVVNHPSIRKVNLSENTTYHVVNEDDYMQLSHLLIFTEKPKPK